MDPTPKTPERSPPWSVITPIRIRNQAQVSTPPLTTPAPTTPIPTTPTPPVWSPITPHNQNPQTPSPVGLLPSPSSPLSTSPSPSPSKGKISKRRPKSKELSRDQRLRIQAQYDTGFSLSTIILTFTYADNN